MANVLYDRAIICHSGHVITSKLDYLPQALPNFCSQCSAPVTTKCIKCEAGIPGSRYVEIVENYRPAGVFRNAQRTVKRFDENFVTPAYCPCCGKPYPWTESTIKEFDEIIDLAEELLPDERDVIKKNFPMLLVDQPGSSAAAMRIAQLLKRAKDPTIIALKSAIASKLAGKALDLLPQLLRW